MPLDPTVKNFLNSLKSENPFDLIDKKPLSEIRSIIRNISASAPKEEVYKIENIKIPSEEISIPARIYTPKDIKEPTPVLIYFHGGGFVFGDIEFADPLCRALANACSCKVVSIEYRLAPEYKFPAAVIDAINSTKWVLDNAEKLSSNNKLVAVAGCSAGGNLAAVTALHFRNKLLYQILAYPVVSALDVFSRSYIEYDGYFLTNKLMKWFYQQYLNDQKEILDWRVSPILSENFENLPETLIITAEYDPLRDQAEAYASKLSESRVSVINVRFAGTIHGFIESFHIIKQGRVAINFIGSLIKSTSKIGD